MKDFLDYLASVFSPSQNRKSIEDVLKPFNSGLWLPYPSIGKSDSDLFTMVRIDRRTTINGGVIDLDIRIDYHVESLVCDIPFQAQNRQIVVIKGHGLKKPGVADRGDLNVMLSVGDYVYQSYPEFGQSGVDLLTRIFITENLAHAGGYVAVKVDSIFDSVYVRIPRNTQDGKVLEIPERGTYCLNDERKRGNLYIQVVVVTELLESKQPPLQSSDTMQGEMEETPENDNAAWSAGTIVADRVSLRKELMRLFSQDDIKLLCFDLGLDSDDVGIPSKPTGVTNLIEYCEKRDRLGDLVSTCKQHRPNGNW